MRSGVFLFLFLLYELRCYVFGGIYLKFGLATSHSTIFDIPMCPVCEDQRHQ